MATGGRQEKGRRTPYGGVATGGPGGAGFAIMAVTHGTRNEVNLCLSSN